MFTEINPEINHNGFTLTELLLSLTLGLIFSILLLKIFSWQNNIHHQIEDILFLDQNGVLSIKILNNILKDAKNIQVIQKGHVIKAGGIDEIFAKKGLYIRKVDQEGKKDNAVEVTSGVEQLTARLEESLLKIHLHLIAPHYHTQADFYETIKLPSS